jgi:hypothetical protein
MMQPENNLEYWDSQKIDQNFEDSSLSLGSSTWNVTQEPCDGEYLPASPITYYTSSSPLQYEELGTDFPDDFVDIQASSTSPIPDFLEPSQPASLHQPSSAQLLNSVYSKPFQENFASHNYDTYPHPHSVYLPMPHLSITPYPPVLNPPFPQYMAPVPGYVNPPMGFPTIPSPPLSSPPYSPPCKIEVPPSPPVQTTTTLKGKYQISSEPPPTEPLRPQTEPLYQTSTPSQLKTPGNSDYYQPKHEQTLSESGGGNQATDTSTIKTQSIFPAPEIPQSQPAPQPTKGTKRQAMTTSIDNRHTKRGVPHDRTPVENFLEQARSINNYEITGLQDYGRYVVLHEDNFFDWIMKKKDRKFTLKKTSFYEKFDKSRPANRVDSKQKTGPYQIKYLRVDKNKNTDYYEYVKHDMENIERKFGVPNMRVITHREWNYLPLKFFVYEGKK